MKKEFITGDELKKIMKLSIRIGVELGFYISYTGLYIQIDRFENMNPDKTQDYYFNRSELPKIFEHITAYSRLHKRQLSLR